MSLIEFDFNKKHLLLLVNIPIYYFVTFFKHNIYTLHFSNITSCIISIFLYKKDKNASKDENIGNSIENNTNDIKESKKNKKTIKTQTQFQRFCNIVRVILVFVIFDLIIMIFFLFDKNIKISFNIISFLTMILYYHFIMKEKIYLHHFIAIIFFFIFTFINPKFYKDLLHEVLYVQIIFYMLLGYIECFIKYMIQIKYVNPYKIAIITIICQTIFDDIKLILQFYFISNKKEFNKKYLEFNFNFKNDICYIISQTLGSIFQSLIIYIFSPFHYLISMEISNFLKTSKDHINDYIYMIGVSISMMIFLEIIILNFFGLSNNTQKKIIERGMYITSIDLNLTLSQSINEQEYDDSDNNDY